MERIKNIQDKERKNWKGVSVKHTGRPGTANIMKRRQHKIEEEEIVSLNLLTQIQEEETRSLQLLRVMNRLRELDDEKRVQFANHNRQTKANSHPNLLARPYYDLLTFKCVKEA